MSSFIKFVSMMRLSYKLSFILLTLLFSCTKADHNGDLGGNWQLNPSVYFSIYNDMAQWRDIHTDGFYQSRFVVTKDSLFLTLNDGTAGMYKNDGTHDSIYVDASRYPSSMCMPQNFAYKIVSVSHNTLRLATPDTVLTFRHY